MYYHLASHLYAGMITWSPHFLSGIQFWERTCSEHCKTWSSVWPGAVVWQIITTTSMELVFLLPYPPCSPRRDHEHIPQEENEPSRSAEGAFPGLSTILRSFKRLSQLGPWPKSLCLCHIRQGRDQRDQWLRAGKRAVWERGVQRKRSGPAGFREPVMEQYSQRHHLDWGVPVVCPTEVLPQEAEIFWLRMSSLSSEQTLWQIFPSSFIGFCQKVWDSTNSADNADNFYNTDILDNSDIFYNSDLGQFRNSCDVW